MELEVNISELVEVSDLLSWVYIAVRKAVVQKTAHQDESNIPDIAAGDNNKSPPDLGVSVSDESKTGEAFGP